MSAALVVADEVFLVCFLTRLLWFRSSFVLRGIASLVAVTKRERRQWRRDDDDACDCFSHQALGYFYVSCGRFSRGERRTVQRGFLVRFLNCFSRLKKQQLRLSSTSPSSSSAAAGFFRLLLPFLFSSSVAIVIASSATSPMWWLLRCK